MRPSRGRASRLLPLALSSIVAASCSHAPSDSPKVRSSQARQEHERLDLAQARAALVTVSLDGATMGTSWRVIARTTAEVRPNAEQLQTALDDFESLVSTWRSDSELALFAAHASDAWYDVSPSTAAVVEQSLEVARTSGGAFDPTLAPVVRLWGFGSEAARPTAVPDQAQLAEARGKVGWSNVQVRRDRPALRKTRPGIELDLSGIAKGYAVDLLAQVLDAQGHTDYLIEIGGELRARGRKSAEQAWRVGIEQPRAGESTLSIALPIENAALATSGDYRQYWEHAGRRYSHLIDPRTGSPVELRGRATHRSVSVLAPTCAAADAWATALYVLGEDEGLRLADERSLAALFLYADEEGERQVASTAFPDPSARR